MAKIEVPNESLLKMGFAQVDSRTNIDNELCYDWFQLIKNGHKIDVAKEYTPDGKFILQYAMLNDVKLQNWHGITVELDNLISLL